MTIQSIVSNTLVFSIFLSGCYHGRSITNTISPECSLMIIFSQTEFLTWADVEFEFSCETDKVYIMRKPYWGMTVKWADEYSRIDTSFSEINKQNFDLSPYPLFLGLVVDAWDNVSTLKEGKGGSKYHSVEPGEYYIEVLYCMSSTGTPRELCVCRSAPFKILVEHGYGGVVDASSETK